MKASNQGQMGQDTGTDAGHPKAGDRFQCQGCGMEIQVTNDCKCQDEEHVHFQCCGREMAKM